MKPLLPSEIQLLKQELADLINDPQRLQEFVEKHPHVVANLNHLILRESAELATAQQAQTSPSDQNGSIETPPDSTLRENAATSPAFQQEAGADSAHSTQGLAEHTDTSPAPEFHAIESLPAVNQENLTADSNAAHTVAAQDQALPDSATASGPSQSTANSLQTDAHEQPGNPLADSKPATGNASSADVKTVPVTAEQTSEPSTAPEQPGNPLADSIPATGNAGTADIKALPVTADQTSAPSTAPEQPSPPLADSKPATGSASTADVKAAPVTADQISAPPPAPTEVPASPALPSDINFPLLSNATVGKPYTFDFPKDNDDYTILSAEFEEDCGLHWDAITRSIIGTPTKSGNLLITFDIYDMQKSRHETITQIFVINPDPQQLWNDLPTDPSAPFRKTDTDVYTDETPHGTLLAGRVRGRSHAHIGSFCDDDMRVLYHPQSGVHAMVVSDGAGSATYSRYGSQLVVEAAIDSLKLLLDDTSQVFSKVASPDADADKRSIIARKLIQHAVYAAYKALSEAVKNHNDVIASEKQLSCTLLIVLSFKLPDDQWYSLGYQIGDGAIALFWPDLQAVKLLGKPDSGEFSGETRFLTRKEADHHDIESRMVEYPHAPTPPIIFAMTDGVSDPKFHTDDQLQHAPNWQRLWTELQNAVLNNEDPKSALLIWLNFWAKGEHDDRTLAMFIPREYKGTTA